MNTDETLHGQAPEKHRMPRWVRVFIALAVGGLVILAAVMLTAEGDHGPGRHQPDTPVDTSTHTPPVDHG